MSLTTRRAATASVILWTALVTGGAAAAEPQTAATALNEVSGAVQWSPLAADQSATLAVSDPRGVVRTFAFPAGQPPALSLFDAAGDSLIDGTYTWELRLTARRGEKPLMQVGYFTLEGGHLVPADLQESPSGRRQLNAEDQTVPDDLIVDGKACLGLACVVNETLGSEALRLKQAAVRLRFEDSSTNPSFPSRDWQLTANEANSGGAEKFSLEDLTAGTVPLTVFGGAPSHSLYVDGAGEVGLGTNVPTAALHLAVPDPAVRFEKTGAPARSWKLAGSDTAFTLTDQGSGGAGTVVPLSITAGAPANSIFVGADGRVGIGTSSPANNLHVRASGNGAGIMIDGGTINAVNMQMQGNSAGFILNDLNGAVSQKVIQQFVNAETFRIRGLNDGVSSETVRGIALSLGSGNVGINCWTSPAADLVIGSTAACNSGTRSEINAGAVQFTAPSSRSLKENLAPLAVDGVLEKISQIDVYSYDFIDGPKDRIGLVAEDFHAVFGRGSDQVISGDEVQLALWLAVKELAARQAEVAELRARLEALEAAVGQVKMSATASPNPGSSGEPNSSPRSAASSSARP